MDHQQKVDVIINELGNFRWFLVASYDPYGLVLHGDTHFILLDYWDTHFGVNPKTGRDGTTICGIDFVFGTTKPNPELCGDQWLWTDIMEAIENGELGNHAYCRKCVAYMENNKHLFDIDLVAAQLKELRGV
jgi:hypothetical protein